MGSQLPGRGKQYHLPCNMQPCIYQVKNGNMKELIEQGQSKQQEASKCSSMQ